MISRAKKYVAVLLVFVCVCMIFSPQTAYAAEDSSQHETVKVGFFAMDGYHVMDEEGNRSGYGYDFLRLMARYWDVDYEYVGYDKSWDDMQQMLEDGEIDMVTSPPLSSSIYSHRYIFFTVSLQMCICAPNHNSSNSWHSLSILVICMNNRHISYTYFLTCIFLNMICQI